MEWLAAVMWILKSQTAQAVGGCSPGWPAAVAAGSNRAAAGLDQAAAGLGLRGQVT